MNPNHRGAIAETAIALEAIRAGVEVFKPLSEHARADLVFGLGQRLLRVQCKSAVRKGAVVIVRLVSNWHSPRGYVRTRYSADEIDLVAAYCHELDRSYLLPFELVAGQTSIQLRLVPPRNGQRAALIWAVDHQLSGAVAQLGERRSGTPKATGSSPVSSTPQRADASAEQVGAHQFRNHFGWYMERTVAGEEFLVTRRGKPCVRLVPAHPQLPIAEGDVSSTPCPSIDSQ